MITMIILLTSGTSNHMSSNIMPRITLLEHGVNWLKPSKPGKNLNKAM